MLPDMKLMAELEETNALMADILSDVDFLLNDLESGNSGFKNQNANWLHSVLSKFRN